MVAENCIIRGLRVFQNCVAFFFFHGGAMCCRCYCCTFFNCISVHRPVHCKVGWSECWMHVCVFTSWSMLKLLPFRLCKLFTPPYLVSAVFCWRCLFCIAGMQMQEWKYGWKCCFFFVCVWGVQSYDLKSGFSCTKLAVRCVQPLSHRYPSCSVLGQALKAFMVASWNCLKASGFC